MVEVEAKSSDATPPAKNLQCAAQPTPSPLAPETPLSSEASSLTPTQAVSQTEEDPELERERKEKKRREDETGKKNVESEWAWRTARALTHSCQTILLQSIRGMATRSRYGFGTMTAV